MTPDTCLTFPSLTKVISRRRKSSRKEPNKSKRINLLLKIRLKKHEETDPNLRNWNNKLRLDSKTDNKPNIKKSLRSKSMLNQIIRNRENSNLENEIRETK